MGEYEPLYEHLKKQKLRRVRMSFAQIEKLLGVALPASAFTHGAWWSNEIDEAQGQTTAWLDAGYRVDGVDPDAGAVQFEAMAT